MGARKFSVFTKPWKDSLEDLGRRVQQMGFDGIELPVRPGYPVPPERVQELPAAARLLGEFGVEICSVAGPTDEAAIAACAEAGVPLIRVMAPLRREGYLETEAALQREYDALTPLLEKYGVTLGIQNHCGGFVSNACGLRRLVEKYDPKQVAVVWDAAHNALNGEEMEIGIDIVWSHLALVNLKNAYWKQTNGPEAESAVWQPYWTDGRHGLASWPRVAAELKRRGYQGDICLPAEYTAEADVDRLAVEDLRYAKSLFPD